MKYRVVASIWICLWALLFHTASARAAQACRQQARIARHAYANTRSHERAPTAMLRSRQALAEATEALPISYFPALRMSGSGGYTFDNRLILPGAPRIDSKSLTTEANVSLEWAAIDLSRGSRADAAEAAARAQGFSTGAARHDALLLAAERYVQAAAATALVKDADLTLARRTEQERAIAGLVQAGTRSPLDLDRAKIETLSARYALAASQRDELAACAALAAAIGRSATQPVCARRGDLAAFVPELSLDGAVSAARSKRPELAARAALRAAATRACPDRARS